MHTIPLWVLVASLGTAVVAGAAQDPAPVIPSAASRVTEGRRALAAGRANDAVASADRVLASAPGHAEAAALKVEALLALGQRGAALDAYDAWFKVARREQPAVAARIASAELDALAATDQTTIKADALGALAGSGRADAKQALTAAAWGASSAPASWPSVVALAALGDAKAGGRLLELARESVGGAKAEALHALAAGKVTGSEPVLRDALAAPDANLQAAAAAAAAALGLRALVPDLERTVKQGDQFGRFAAAVAAAKLGGTASTAMLEAGLTSPALDARLQAAAGLKALGRRGWVEVVRPLLDSADGLLRFQAAELLLSVDRPPAMKVLLAGTVDPNLAVRAETARILTADPDVEIAQFRRLLRDGAPRVRLLAARALLRT